MHEDQKYAEWTDSEFSTLNFHDERLTNRFLLTARRMMASPESSLSQALKSKAEVKGAYRLFGNQRVDVGEILSSHQVEVARRIRNKKTILAIQDTTLLVYSGHKKTTGLGELGRVYTSNDKGLFLHSCLAIDPNGVPFGIFSHQCWARDRPFEKTECRMTRRRKRQIMTAEEKESFKWMNSLEDTMKVSIGSDARIITIADREADYSLLMARVVELGGGFVIRARTNRTTFDHNMQQSDLYDRLKGSPCKGKLKIVAPIYEASRNKVVDVEVKFFAAAIDVRERPWKTSSSKLPLWVVEAREAGSNRKNHLHWVLLTSEPVLKFEDAQRILEWYKKRWTIEIYFKTLKSGLHVEECRLGSADRLFRFMALAAIIGYRVLYLSRISRANPDESCRIALSDQEWRVLVISFLQRKNIPNSPPTIHEAVTMIAKLGGYQSTINGPPPGPIVVWRGLKALGQRVQMYEILS